MEDIVKKVNGKLKSLKVNKNVNVKDNLRDNAKENNNKNVIITYSMLEQSRNNIMGIGKTLLIYVGVFPFIPLLLSLFSCFIKKLPNHIYKLCFFCIAIFGVVIMVSYMLIWLKNVMTVFIIDENSNLYRIKISVFWYKIKDKMYLLNPGGATGNRLTRLFYMVNNIKLVLETAMDDITYDEFISMGRMERLSDIVKVQITNKRIAFNASVTSKSGKVCKRIKVMKAFEQTEKFCEYLKMCAESGTEAAKNIKFDGKISNVEDLILKNVNVSPLIKLRKFTLKWTCVMAWISAITLSGDLGRLSRINAGEYVLREAKELSTYHSDDKKDIDETEKIYVNINNEKDYFKKSEYGVLYKPMVVIYIFPLIVYVFMLLTDKVIDNVKNNKN